MNKCLFIKKMPGASNGGMFIWSRVMERLAGSLASVGPVCSAPLRQGDIFFIVYKHDKVN